MISSRKKGPNAGAKKVFICGAHTGHALKAHGFFMQQSCKDTCARLFVFFRMILVRGAFDRRSEAELSVRPLGLLARSYLRGGSRSGGGSNCSSGSSRTSCKVHPESGADVSSAVQAELSYSAEQDSQTLANGI